MTSSKKMQQPSIFGQMVFDNYTIILLDFPVSDKTARENIVAALDQAAVKLISAFPALSGQVVVEGRSATSSGTYRIVPYHEHDGKTPVRVKDCTESCSSYEEFVAARAPFSMLDGDILSPAKGFGDEYDITKVVFPVLMIQANFIRGGLLLCFSCHHNACDMNGQGQVIRLFATACRGENFPADMVEAGNCDTTNLLPCLKAGERLLNHSEILKPSRLQTQSNGVSERPDAAWRYWRFPISRLVRLKLEASADLESGWILTNDAILALLWQRLTTIRHRFGRYSSGDECAMVRSVNGRHCLEPPIPEGFMGHLVAMASVKMAVAEVMKAPLSKLAFEIRRGLNEIDDYHIRSMTTLIRDEPDRTKIFYDALHHPGKDILNSSWADLRLAAANFGPLLGHAAIFRRPRLALAPDLTYLLPRTREGCIDIALCLTQKELEGLAKDDVWSVYTEYIG